MSNLSEHKEVADYLQTEFNEGRLTETEYKTGIDSLYFNSITLALVKMADDIHEISRTLKEMNRRR